MDGERDNVAAILHTTDVANLPEQPRPFEGEELVSTADFARRIGVKTGTVKRWIHEGMPRLKTGTRRVRLPLASARSWAERHHGRSVAFRRKGAVYFGIHASGAVKIGFSSDVDRRAFEVDARVIARVPGDIRMERMMHGRFADHRVEGELYRNEGAIAAFLQFLLASRFAT